jgi:6-phosphogluconolactonase
MRKKTFVNLVRSHAGRTPLAAIFLGVLVVLASYTAYTQDQSKAGTSSELTSQSPFPSPASAGAPAITKLARFAYLFENSDIVAYTVNPATSQLRAVGSIPLQSVATDFSATVQANKFLYVPSGAMVGSPINGYHINPSTGLLTSLAGAPFASSTGAAGLSFTKDGRFAFGGGSFYGSTQVESFSVNTTSGALSSLATYASGNPPCGQAITPSSSFLYVPNYNSPGTIYGYSVDVTTGALTALVGSPFSGHPFNCGAFAHQTGKFLFVMDSGTGSGAQVSVYAINSTTGALTEVSGSPFFASGALYTGAFATDPTGKFLYGAVGPSNNGGAPGILVGYSINLTTGALTPVPGSPYTVGDLATGVSIDPSGKFLYSTDSSSSGPVGFVFSIDGSTGALTRIDQQGIRGASGNTGALVTGTKAVQYSPRFAYVTNQTDQSISEYTINDTTGALTAVIGSPLSDGNGPQVVAATPNGKFVFTGNSNGSISEYKVDPTTGSLTLVTGSPLKGLGNPVSLVVDPKSKFLLVADQTSKTLSSYTISGTGVLKLKKSASVSVSPTVVALDPTGERALVAAGTSTLYYFTINADGSIGSSSSYNAGNLPVASSIDPTSQYLFQVNNAENTVDVYTLLNTGVQSGAPVYATGNSPSAVLAEPSGRYVYVANSADNAVSGYSLDNSSGVLTPIAGTFPTGSGPDSLAASNDGKYLYAVCKNSGTVSIFIINSDGTLTVAGSATTGTAPTSITTVGTYK